MDKNTSKTGSQNPDNVDPQNSGEAPRNDGLETTAGDNGLGDIQPLLEKHGFSSFQDMYNSWLETKKDNSRTKNELSSATKMLQELQQSAQSKGEPEPSEDDIANMIMSNPKGYEQYLAKKLRKELGIDQIAEGYKTLSAQNALNQLYSKHEDFREFQPEIEQELEAMGHDSASFASIGGLERVYELVKLRKFGKTVQGKKKTADESRQEREISARKAAGANISGNSTGESELQERSIVKHPIIGEVPEDDLNLVRTDTYRLD